MGGESYGQIMLSDSAKTHLGVRNTQEVSQEMTKSLVDPQKCGA